MRAAVDGDNGRRREPRLTSQNIAAAGIRNFPYPRGAGQAQAGAQESSMTMSDDAERARQRYRDRVGGVGGGSGAMFDRIARRYDLLNRVMSLGLDQGWRRRLVHHLDLADGGEVLDVATGTGDVALALAGRWRRATVVGLDPSLEMLARARAKIAARQLAARVRLVAGDGAALPFADATFNAAVIAFGIRNMTDREQGLREMRRVTRPGGRIAVLELAEPRHGPVAAFARFHVHELVPRLGALLSGAPEYRYLQASIAAFPPADAFRACMERCGIGDVRIEPLGFGATTLFVGEASA